MIGHLNTCNLYHRHILNAANSIQALPAGSGYWYVPGEFNRLLTTEEMLRVAADSASQEELRR